MTSDTFFGFDRELLVSTFEALHKQWGCTEKVLWAEVLGTISSDLERTAIEYCVDATTRLAAIQTFQFRESTPRLFT